jgi:NTE family protein
MNAAKHAATATARPADFPGSKERIVLVLQGGGALGAYQAGVYQALHEAGMEPDWVIGTSIGAINASLIAGNAVEERLPRLQGFWHRMAHTLPVQIASGMPVVGGMLTQWMTVMGGLPSFFRPHPPAFASPHWKLGAEAAGYYSTEPLRETLTELVDFNLVNSKKVRLTVGAANVRTGEMTYFDNHRTVFDVRHVMASGALPPAFPAVLIDGELFWDGGVLSNTPVEAVFDDNPRRSSLVFAVHLWNPRGADPESIWQVMSRQKDLQYSSRAHTHIARQKQIHKLRHVVAELTAKLPEQARTDNEVRELASYGCLTRMHVVRLLAPTLKGEDHTKDIDFSPTGIEERWNAGLADTRATIARAPWTEQVDPMEGLILHDVMPGMAIKTS